MKQSKHLATLVESTKIECYYFKRADLKALFELYYKVNDIHIGYEWEYSGMYNAGAIPAGTYLIESEYYSDGCS